MNTEELKKINEIEKELHKRIDDEVALEREMDEIATYAAKSLAINPVTTFTVQNRDFLIVASTYDAEDNQKGIQIVAREKLAIMTPMAKILKADLVIDPDYTQEENLVAGLKAILAKITGYIKPEAVE